jgi:hypothetical protein
VPQLCHRWQISAPCSASLHTANLHAIFNAKMGPFWNSLLRLKVGKRAVLSAVGMLAVFSEVGKLAVLSKVSIDDPLNERHLPSAARARHGHHESARQSRAMYRLPDECTVFGNKFA